jgi:HEAT repeat protein
MSTIAEFQESIVSAIPQIIAFLSDSNSYVRSAGANTLLKLSEQGKNIKYSGLALLMSSVAEFQESIGSTIPQIIAFLSDSDSYVRLAGANILLKLSEQGKNINYSGLALLMSTVAVFQESIGSAIPQIIAFLGDSNSDVRLAGANALSKVSDQGKNIKYSGLALLMSTIAKFQESIVSAIPQIIALLSDSDLDVCLAGANTLLKLSEQGKNIKYSGLALLMSTVAEFRESIGSTIPQIITFLSDSDSNIRLAGAEALSELSEQGKNIKYSSLALLMSTLAEFRESIGSAIPQIITFLSDSDSDVRLVSAVALLKLLDQGKNIEYSGLALLMTTIAEFQESIGSAVPQIITFLSDSNSDLRLVGAKALLKLSEQGKNIKYSGLDLLMSSVAKFQESIGFIIPQIITFLSNSNWDVRSVGANALLKLSEQGKNIKYSGLALLMSTIAEFQESIVSAIPQIIALLSDSDLDVCLAGANTLLKLSEQGKNIKYSGLALLMSTVAEFRESIGSTIPQIITFLSDSDSNIRLAGAEALSKLSEQGKNNKYSSLALLMSNVAEFRESIGSAIPQIITFLSDSDSDVRLVSAVALLKLLDQGKNIEYSGLALLMTTIAEFQESIGSAVPQIITFLSDSNSDLRLVGAKALLKLSEQGKNIEYSGLDLLISTIAKFRESIGSTIPRIITFLSDSNSNFRLVGAKVLLELSEQGKNIKYSGLAFLMSSVAAFQESIGSTIPQIIAFLSDSDSYVRLAGANILLKLSEQGKNINYSGLALLMSTVAVFQESIGSAIPQIIAFLGDRNSDVRLAGANALSKVSDQGKNIK